MALYPDEEDPTKPKAPGAAGAQPAAPQTFAQLQARGMPRPPSPAMNALYGASGAAPYGGPAPQAPPPMQPSRMPAPGGAGGINPGPSPLDGGGQPLYGGGGLGHPTGGNLPPGLQVNPGTGGGATPGHYNPTGQLDQGNLEGYLYDMLANPTATPTYQNAMKNIGSNIDTDASKRGVFYSTIPVGSYANAGANLASGLQGQAYNQLQGYNQNYEQLLMSLLGAS